MQRKSAQGFTSPKIVARAYAAAYQDALERRRRLLDRASAADDIKTSRSLEHLAGDVTEEIEEAKLKLARLILTINRVLEVGGDLDDLPAGCDAWPSVAIQIDGKLYTVSPDDEYCDELDIRLTVIDLGNVAVLG
ncbi:hypothetical protein [Singulisphaera sp. PoT]|uniref:hypothetical protein n=1 Tax=Singulisphaera sp. PoT TaxID=3411797 RepID=UPI003BF61346